MEEVWVVYEPKEGSDNLGEGLLISIHLTREGAEEVQSYCCGSEVLEVVIKR